MSDKKATSPKMYVLDTNVLLHDPRAIFSFDKSSVAIPIVVLEEMDTFKGESSERGKNAREFIRYLDNLRKEGSLKEGVPLENGGIFRILFTPEGIAATSPLNVDLVDNEILLAAAELQKEGFEVQFISKDLNARVKADVLGIESQDYLKGSVPRNEFYKGWIRLLVPAVQLKKAIPDDLIEFAKEYNFILNEFILVESQHNAHNNKLFRFVGGKQPFKEILAPQLKWQLGARNPQQAMALDVLFDPAIELVTLLGQAGTGKTFLTLLAGLHQVVVEDVYQKLLVSRPVVPLGPDMGYLPGDLQEKLHSWMQPVYDNVDVILHASTVGRHLKNVESEGRNIQEENGHKDGNYESKKRAQKKEKKGKHSLFSVDELISQEQLSLEAITYMRGRSIPYQFIFIDEVQNLSPHEVKTIVSRVGQGSKIILCGDPYQIDSPYLDFSSNGLVITSDKFKGQELFATVYLENSERSVLSQLAGDLL